MTIKQKIIFRQNKYDITDLSHNITKVLNLSDLRYRKELRANEPL